jgi:xylulokinase
MSVLGIDIGTSGCKASVVDAEGRITGQAYKEYCLASPGPGMQEIDPELVWRSTKDVILLAASAAAERRASPVRAISVSSFGEAVVPVDASGRPLRNAILYIDRRGAEEAKAMGERLGPERVHAITGAPVHSMYSISKILWIKRNEPEIFRETYKFLLLADYTLVRLGARPHSDYSLAARTQAFDVVKKRWSPEILDFAEVDEGKFGEAVQAGSVVGELGRELAHELGMAAGTLLVAGGHDQPCAALGAGVIGSGFAVDGLGSTECVTPAFDEPVINEAMAKSGFACVPHVVPGFYVTYAFTFTCGSVLKWFRDHLAGDRRIEAERRGLDVFDLLIEEAAGSPSPLLLLPHFAGAATPYMDADARGAIIGLGIETTGRDIVRAILEGVTYEMMVNVECLAEAGVAVEELRAVGGMSKSEAYLQLKADMMGRRISSLDVPEAGTLGVAILAGVASGLYPDIESAVGSLVHRKREFEPDMAMHARYLERFTSYKLMYPAVDDILRGRKGRFQS